MDAWAADTHSWHFPALLLLGLNCSTHTSRSATLLGEISTSQGAAETSRAWEHLAGLQQHQ